MFFVLVFFLPKIPAKFQKNSLTLGFQTPGFWRYLDPKNIPIKHRTSGGIWKTRVSFVPFTFPKPPPPPPLRCWSRGTYSQRSMQKLLRRPAQATETWRWKVALLVRGLLKRTFFVMLMGKTCSFCGYRL